MCPKAGNPQSDLLQGTLDVLILKTLSTGAMHGWGIAQRIQQLSAGRAGGQPGLALSGAPPPGRAGLDRRPSGAAPRTTGGPGSTA